MHNPLTLGSITFGPGFKDFDRFFVGFEEQVDRFSKIQKDVTKNISTYPPYNILKTGDTTYAIELAVAGFSRSEIDIQIEENTLTVTGESEPESPTNTYMFKGIASRNFSRTFALEDQIQVRDAEMINGMLRIFLERVIPEHKKPKKIEINDVGSIKPKKAKPMGELLLEEKQYVK